VEATAYGTLYWVLAPVALTFALVLYYFLRRRVPLWLLIPLVIVLAPLGVLAVILYLMPLWAVLLPLYAELSGQPWGGVAIGYNSQPHPLQVYMLVGAAALLIVAIIVYLIRRS